LNGIGIINMFPIHKDERGSFQELAHENEIVFGQLSLLKVNPKCTRGGHYHTYKEEWFCCIRGKCLMEMIDVKTKRVRKVELDGEKPEFIYILPYESHSVINNYDEPCELLVIVSEIYDEKTHDTYKYERL
jgi:dTDP-4-dehydrorhamnose 3,5-epimerase-like enzyme